MTLKLETCNKDGERLLRGWRAGGVQNVALTLARRTVVQKSASSSKSNGGFEAFAVAPRAFVLNNYNSCKSSYG
eukprot:2468777-Pyramimonas_sp.AAC.1